jgi:hypothetical protein
MTWPVGEVTSKELAAVEEASQNFLGKTSSALANPTELKARSIGNY